MSKFKDTFISSHEHSTVINSFWIIPLVLGFTKYSLKPKGSNNVSFVAFAINILNIEIRLFWYGSEGRTSKRAKRRHENPKPKATHVSIYQNPETGQCMFIPAHNYAYENTIIGFTYVDTIFAKSEEEMIEKLKKYEPEERFKLESGV